MTSKDKIRILPIPSSAIYTQKKVYKYTINSLKQMERERKLSSLLDCPIGLAIHEYKNALNGTE